MASRDRRALLSRVIPGRLALALCSGHHLGGRKRSGTESHRAEMRPVPWARGAPGIGAMPTDTWAQTVAVAKGANIITADPDAGAYRTDLADAARTGVTEDLKGAGFTPVTVPVTPGGK